MEWFNHLLPVVQNYTSLGYWLIFLISFFEALVFVGSFIPGTPIIILYGILAAAGHFNLGDLIILAILGAVAGDGVSFYLGTRSKKLFHEKNFLFNTKYLEKSQKFFTKYGNLSIFWGRFIGVIKPFIPFVAGLSGMSTKRFVFWNIFSGIIWALAHLYVGYFFGGALKLIETWISRLGIIALISLIFFLVLWFAIRKGEKALEYTTSFIHSTGWSFVNSLPVRWFYHKFPRIYSFIFGRLKNDSFWGLPLSLLIISLLIVAFSFFSITKSVLASQAVVALDLKIENLLLVFRDSFLVKFFLWVTALGEYQIIITAALVATAIFWLWKKRFYIMSLWITVMGSAASAYLAKMLINRARPGGDIPVYTEHFFSFPSGHATTILALGGFLVYCIWRNFKTWKIRVNSFFIICALILLVGFSRLYLGLHFLSDVLGGYLIGFFWLLLGIAISEWLIIRSRRRGGADIIEEIQIEKHLKHRQAMIKLFTGFLVFAGIFYIISFVSNFKPIFNSVTQNAERQILVRDMSDPLFEKYIPKFPENLMGDYQAPLNFIIVAEGDEAFKSSMLKTGWLPADKMSPRSFTKMLLSYLNNTGYDRAPITPFYWHGQPNVYTFEKAVAGGNFGARYIARFWPTDIATEDGGFVYVGSAAFDSRTEYAFFRVISSDLNTARDELFKDMLDHKIISTYERKQFVDNSKGEYYEKGKYVTDGKAYLIYLR